MAKVINIIGSDSNVGKTYLMEGLIKEIRNRGLTVATIKHDVHGFDIDKKGKDTYKHREAGAETVIISSKNRYAMIKEVKEEIDLNTIIKSITDKDIILVEGYKNSDLRKIEVFHSEISDKVISAKNKLIAIASNVEFAYEEIPVLSKENYKKLVDFIEKEEDYKIEY